MRVFALTLALFAAIIATIAALALPEPAVLRVVEGAPEPATEAVVEVCCCRWGHPSLLTPCPDVPRSHASSTIPPNAGRWCPCTTRYTRPRVDPTAQMCPLRCIRSSQRRARR